MTGQGFSVSYDFYQTSSSILIKVSNSMIYISMECLKTMYSN